MSSFYCEKCGKAIIDTPYKGYISECEHYPLSEKNILSPNKKGRISHEEILRINEEAKNNLNQ